MVLLSKIRIKSLKNLIIIRIALVIKYLITSFWDCKNRSVKIKKEIEGRLKKVVKLRNW